MRIMISVSRYGMVGSAMLGLVSLW